MQKVRQFVSRAPAPVQSQKEMNIPARLTEYFEKQSKTQHIQPFNVRNFEAFDRAIYDYMVELRQHTELQKFTNKINNLNASNLMAIKNLRNTINKQPITPELKSVLYKKIDQKQLNLLNSIIQKNTKSYNNAQLQSYRSELNKAWRNLSNTKARLSENNRRTLENKYTRHIISINSRLKPLTNNLESNRKKRAATNVALKLWNYAGTGFQSNTSYGRRQSLNRARGNQTLNLTNIQRANINSILNNSSIQWSSNQQGNNHARHKARVMSLFNDLKK
jgi:hypothetical protein